VDYVGRALIGDDLAGPYTHVRIADVEDLRWEAVVLDPAPEWVSDETLRVTLADEGVYVGWSANARVVSGADGGVLLRGEEPLTPPVGG
jgi:hypothetical protein